MEILYYHFHHTYLNTILLRRNESSNLVLF